MSSVLQSEAGGGRLACRGGFCWRVMGGGKLNSTSFGFFTNLVTGIS
jgi:hypothetical protein